jgi:hypothetical protein
MMTEAQQQEWDNLMATIGMDEETWTSKLEHGKVLLRRLDRYHSHTLKNHRSWIRKFGRSLYNEEAWLNWNTFHKDFTEKLWHWIDDEEDRIFFENRKVEEEEERLRRHNEDITNRRSNRLLIKRLATGNHSQSLG